MSVIDLETRLMNYIRKNIFGKNWELDGETPAEAFLGKGTYGKVYAVVCDAVIGGRVTRQYGALKLIPVDETIFDAQTAQELSDEEKMKRMRMERRKDEQEIGIMEKVSSTTEIAYFLNSAIIERRDTRLKSWDVLILMDRHQSMAKYLQDRNLAPGSPEFLPVVLRIWRDMSRALVHCQNCSILHNDIKPANLLYSPSKESFVLGDFGEALPQSIYPANKAVRGTLDYMSPEMYQKRGGDSRMDMYSLAMTIYELLNGGRVPLEDSLGRSQAWKTRMEGKKPIPPIKGVPDDVNAVLLRCLEYDPEKRYHTCKELESDVLRLYVEYTNRPPRARNGRKYIFIGAGAAAALALGGALFLLVRLLSGDGGQPEPTQATAILEESIAPADTPTEVPAEMPAETLTETPTATPTETPTATPTATSTPAASPAPALALQLGKVDTPIERDGENITIRGSFVAQGEFEPEQLTLLVNGEEWSVELGEAQDDGERSFVARGTLGEDVLRVSVQLALDINGERVTTNASSLPVMRPELTPTPAPTPEPKLELRLEEQQLMAGTGDLTLHGEVSVEGELTSDDLSLWVNNNYVNDVLWQATTGGYSFEANVMVDLEGMDQLLVRVTLQGNETVESTGALPVVTPSPEPTHALSALELDAQEALTAQPVSGSGSLTISGRAEPGEALVCSVNGEIVSDSSVVDADGSFALELSGRLLADGENAVRLSYYGAPDDSPALEFTLVCDRQGPEIECVDRIDQFTTELYARANDAAQPCGVALVVDGETVMEGECDANGEVSFRGIDGLGLSAERSIELVATDALGNSSSRTISFVRSLTSINVTNRARLEATPIGQAGASVELSALPGAMLFLKLGDAPLTSLRVDDAGSASVQLGAAELAQGENLLSIGYEEVDGAEVAEDDAQRIQLKLNYDGEAPDFLFVPNELVRGERMLTLSVSNEASYQAALYVDGEQVAGGSFSDAEPHALEIPEGVDLEGARSIELAVTDAAGNESRSIVPTLFIAPIAVENAAQLQEGVKGINDAVSLRLSGMPGAELTLTCGQKQDTLTLGGNGTLISDLRPLLRNGENDISIEYAPSNGFLVRALAGTAAELSLNYDHTAPDFIVDADYSWESDHYPWESDPISPDTTQLTVRVFHEPNGVELTLYVDGDPVWREAVRDAQECVIPNIDDLSLTEESEIRVEVRDMANNSAEQTLHYSSTDRISRFGDGGLWGSVEPVFAGEIAQIDAWVICNESDMEYVRIVLVDEKGTERDCEIINMEADDEHYAELVPQVKGELITDYADRAYRIGSVLIPSDCPSGTHVLKLYIGHPGMYDLLNLGTIEVLQREVLVHENKFADAGLWESIEPTFGSNFTQIDAWVLSNDADMENARMVIVGANGTEHDYGDSFHWEPDDEHYAELVSRENGEINTDYADRAYRIRDELLNYGFSSGTHELKLLIDTQFGEQLSLDLGTVEILPEEVHVRAPHENLVVSAGEWVELDNEILCNSDDFEDAHLVLSRVDGRRQLLVSGDLRFNGEELDGEIIKPDAEIIKLDADRYLQLMTSFAGKDLNASYVDSAYSIASIKVPEDCSSGLYLLQLSIKTQNLSRSNILATLEVGQMEAYADSDGPSVTGQAGEKVDIDAWVLCSSEDFNSMKRRLSLVDDSGATIECGSFTAEPMDDALYQRRLSSVSVRLDTSVANTGYTLTDITIPQNCPDGTYRLVLEMETQNNSGADRYKWILGGVDVTSSEQVEIAD